MSGGNNMKYFRLARNKIATRPCVSHRSAEKTKTLKSDLPFTVTPVFLCFFYIHTRYLVFVLFVFSRMVSYLTSESCDIVFGAEVA